MRRRIPSFSFTQSFGISAVALLRHQQLLHFGSHVFGKPLLVRNILDCGVFESWREGLVNARTD
jgi:hypothetical protein